MTRRPRGGPGRGEGLRAAWFEICQVWFEALFVILHNISHSSCYYYELLKPSPSPRTFLQQDGFYAKNSSIHRLSPHPWGCTRVDLLGGEQRGGGDRSLVPGAVLSRWVSTYLFPSCLCPECWGRGRGHTYLTVPSCCCCCVYISILSTVYKISLACNTSLLQVCKKDSSPPSCLWPTLWASLRMHLYYPSGNT